jgi:plastocyanin
MLNRWNKEFAVIVMLGVLTISLGARTLSDVDSHAHKSKTDHSSGASSQVINKEMSLKPETKMRAVNTVANQIVIENFSFVPATLVVKAGTTVTWVNRDDAPHTATDTDKRFNSKALDTNDQFSFTFSQPGTYNYYCALHPKMTGQIIVK